jgi:hypothetical protein
VHSALVKQPTHNVLLILGMKAKTKTRMKFFISAKIISWRVNMHEDPQSGATQWHQGCDQFERCGWSIDQRPHLDLDWWTSRLAIRLFSKRDPAGRRWRRHEEVGSILDEKKIMAALQDAHSTSTDAAIFLIFFSKCIGSGNAGTKAPNSIRSKIASLPAGVDATRH